MKKSKKDPEPGLRVDSVFDSFFFKNLINLQSADKKISESKNKKGIQNTNHLRYFNKDEIDIMAV